MITDQPKRVVFTEGGKGGVAKTEVVLSVVAWYHQQGIPTFLLDFDIENTDKSGLQNFYPEAIKLDVHKEGALDEFFEICNRDEDEVIVADLGAGAGAATFSWFDQTFEDAQDFDICFTAIGVTTNEADSVQSILKWASHLQDRVDYLIVLNEMKERNSEFEYWHDEKAVKSFVKTLNPNIMKMGMRVQEFQSELRNQTTTLQKVLVGDVNTAFLRKPKNLARARRYQRELFAGFDKAAEILL